MSTTKLCPRLLPLLVGVLALAWAGAAAAAPTPGDDAAFVSGLHLRPLRLADVTVETPPAVAPTPVETGPRKVVQTDVHSPSYMGTIAGSALGGAVLGAAIGTAIYYLGSNQRARNIIYWAAGGVLVGAGVGVIQVMVEESRTSAVMSGAPADPAPTFRLALYHRTF